MNVLKNNERKIPGGPASTAGGTGSTLVSTKILPHGTAKNKQKT